MAASRMLQVSAALAGERLDAFLASSGAYSSRSQAANAVSAGKVFVNGAEKPKKYAVCAGDTVVYEVDEGSGNEQLQGQYIPLDIRYEDEDLIVLSKQAGLVCHPSVDHLDGTLVNALVYHCGFEHLCDVQGEQDRYGIVHRLDGDTSGLMLAAKNDETGYALMEAIQERAVDRRYLCLVHGIVAHDTGMVDAPIARSASNRMKMAVRDCDSARDALTTFKVLERFDAGPRDDGYTLVECKLYTGRTHQIRVHMEYIRHPVVGDQLYTAHMPHAESANLGLSRQFLHSYRLAFEHPTTGDQLSFEDVLPDDLMTVYGNLADRSRGRTEAAGNLLTF